MSATATPLVLNGSHGEGGGAMLRTALAISALTEQPVRIHNIRGATRRPGISSEDLTFVRALEQISGAKLTGDDLKSCDLTFVPSHPPRAIRRSFDIHEHEKGNIPGNALIILESLLPVLSRTGAYSKVVVQGETYNPNTLTYDAFERVTLAAHRRQGIYAFPRLELAGFGYSGRGEVSLEVEPSGLECIDWSKRGELIDCRAIVVTASLQKGVETRADHKIRELFTEIGQSVEVEHIEVPSRQPGAFVTILAEFENGMGSGSAIGARGVRIEQVVDTAFSNFFQWFHTEATVDPFLADQLLIPAALADGVTTFSTSCITQRLITLAWVIKQFFPIHVTILGREGEPGMVTINR